uniref:Uncharacterized protein n=1 Tax=Lactuca sativa TaxID=4236 RepID=A0A9R1UZP3_LACSA|nr:hypothetical protein LSAT_V11C700370490 [Lactuca sativa]
MLTEAIHDYNQWTFDERILISASLTTVLNPYAKILLHKGYKSLFSGKQQISRKRSISALVLGIACGHVNGESRHSNIHKLPDMVKIYYRAYVFQTSYQSQTVHPLPCHN